MTLTREIARSHYKVAPLREVVEFLDHRRRPVKESDREPGPYPYYGANGQQGTVDKFIFDEPLILVAEDGGHFEEPSRGIAYSISGRTWVNNHAHVLKPKRELVDFGFLLRVLENYDVGPFISGTTRGKLTKAQAEKIEIPLPPLDEQRRIAAILDKADALRRKRKLALELLDGLIQSIFLEMFSDVSIYGTLADVVKEFRYGTSNKSTDDGYFVLRIPNVFGGKIDLSELKRVPLSANEYARLSIKMGDILIVRTNGNREYVGRCAVVDERLNRDGMSINQFVYASYLIRARLDNSRVAPNFVTSYLSSAKGRKALLERAKTSAGQYNINVESLSSIPIPIPPLLQQHRYSSIFSSIVAKKEKVQVANIASDELFTSLQHRAFSGQL